MFGNIAVIKKSGIEYFNFFDAITDEEAFGRTGLSQDDFVNVTIGGNVIRKNFFVINVRIFILNCMKTIN